MTVEIPRCLHYAAFTHPGKRYRQNQDALLLAGDVLQLAGFWHGQKSLTEKTRFALADGAGGLPNGSAASRTLLQNLAELDACRPQLLPRQRLIPLQNRLVKAVQSQRSLRNAGSTLITAEINMDGQISLWHVGDSRAYLRGPNGLRRLTDDHTLAFCLARTQQHEPGNLQAFAKTHMGRALDNLFVFSPEAEEPFISLQTFQLGSNERLLMVSDGITRYCDDTTLHNCLAGDDVKSDLQKLFEWIMQTPAEDNVSAVLLSLKE